MTESDWDEVDYFDRRGAALIAALCRALEAHRIYYGFGVDIDTVVEDADADLDALLEATDAD